MAIRQHRGRDTGCVLAALAAGFALVVAVTWGARTQGQDLRGAAARLELAKQSFARPGMLPEPPDNPQTPQKVALGKKLFEDRSLSANGRIACASCHDARLSFADGERTSTGVTGAALKRHSPTLWNVAWAPLLFWDGRAGSLEEQVLGPLEHPDEMGERVDAVVSRLAASAEYKALFAAAFPGSPAITAANLAAAIAAYERTLVSPPTAFDRWIVGDPAALNAAQIRGFALFTGKARCATCHSGFAFTDHGFYDIGLPGADLGRGPVLGVAAVNSAFKTPTLRELVWTAPYMHDGSIATLEQAVRHYERGGERRPTRARELASRIELADRERADLVAFLESLSSRQPPAPSTEPWVAAGLPRPGAQQPAAVSTTVSQVDKRFSPASIRLRHSQQLEVLNDDSRIHNVRIFDRRLDYNSGAQSPGESVRISFPEAGTYAAFCGIHPTMRLSIEVTAE